MHFIKLQVGCFIVVMYICLVYFKSLRNKKGKVKSNKIFKALLFITPLNIIFDGITGITVNHLDTIPENINLLLHCLFYIFVNLDIFVSFLFLISITTGFPKTTIKRFFIDLPFVLAIIFIFVFMQDTQYLEGKFSYYSHGLSASTCYFTSLYYFGYLLIITIFKRRYIESKKKISIFSFLVIAFLVFTIQTIWPYTLFICIPPTLFLLIMYMSYADPALRQLQRYSNDMVTNFATLVENRDDNTGGHIKRTQGYVRIILRKMLESKTFKATLTRDFLHNMNMAAPMHDIGKISTPDYILQKPGKLTDEEYAIMKEHAVRGGEIIKETFADLNEPEFLDFAYNVARFHHEKWNGTGYPDKLMGTDIPLAARIMAIADVFDAISAKRCYRDAMPIDKCFQIIEEGKGVAFDPILVDLFLSSKKEIITLYSEKI